MLAVNLKPELTKLPILERLNLMMHHRACLLLSLPSPTTEDEYNAIDSSIKTSEEIKVYNRVNRAFVDMMYISENTNQFYYLICIEVAYLAKMKLINYQTESMTDGINYFLFSIREDIKGISQKQKQEITSELVDCLNSNGVLFHKFTTEDEKNDEGETITFIKPEIKIDEGSKKQYHKALENHRSYKEKFDIFLNEYNKREAESGLIIQPFKDFLKAKQEDIEHKQKLIDNGFFLLKLET